jgi:hypothetical protein
MCQFPSESDDSHVEVHRQFRMLLERRTGHHEMVFFCYGSLGQAEKQRAEGVDEVLENRKSGNLKSLRLRFQVSVFRFQCFVFPP